MHSNEEDTAIDANAADVSSPSPWPLAWLVWIVEAGFTRKHLCWISFLASARMVLLVTACGTTLAASYPVEDITPPPPAAIIVKLPEVISAPPKFPVCSSSMPSAELQTLAFIPSKGPH